MKITTFKNASRLISYIIERDLPLYRVDRPVLTYYVVDHIDKSVGQEIIRVATTLSYKKESSIQYDGVDGSTLIVQSRIPMLQVIIPKLK